MYRPDWLKFSWDLNTLPEAPLFIKGVPEIRLCERGDEKQFWDVMERSFLTEIGWGPLKDQRISECRQWAPDLQDGRDTRCLVLVDGKRIVGGSLLSTDADNIRHLISGVFVIEEYRCRGAGRAVLWKSLQMLKDAGLGQACAVTRSNLPAAKYLYPKFNSQSEVLKNNPSLRQAA